MTIYDLPGDLWWCPSGGEACRHFSLRRAAGCCFCLPRAQCRGCRRHIILAGPRDGPKPPRWPPAGRRALEIVVDFYMFSPRPGRTGGRALKLVNFTVKTTWFGGAVHSIKSRRCGVASSASNNFARRRSVSGNAERGCLASKAVRTSFSRSDDVQFERSLSGNLAHPSFR